MHKPFVDDESGHNALDVLIGLETNGQHTAFCLCIELGIMYSMIQKVPREL